MTPALAAANNGNWHTAARWSRMLRSHYEARLLAHWHGPGDSPGDALVALHARRSAASIDAWARLRPGSPLIVVLTGTDLYRDIRSDADAQRSLQQATRLIVLQDQGLQELPAALRPKCEVVFQSAPALRPATRATARLTAVMAGHLRAEKDPLTFMRAAQRLAGRRDLRLEHIGSALDETLGQAALDTAASLPNYRWLGGLPRAATRQRIRRAHVLVNASLMEGGAQVVIEAVQSGTAVIASRIGGHTGLLGASHPGFFEVGDDAALARLLQRARDEPAFLQSLLDHGRSRAVLFSPDAERGRLLHLLRTELQPALETPG